MFLRNDLIQISDTNYLSPIAVVPRPYHSTTAYCRVHVTPLNVIVCETRPMDNNIVSICNKWFLSVHAQTHHFCFSFGERPLDNCRLVAQLFVQHASTTIQQADDAAHGSAVGRFLVKLLVQRERVRAVLERRVCVERVHGASCIDAERHRWRHRIGHLAADQADALEGNAG